MKSKIKNLFLPFIVIFIVVCRANTDKGQSGQK